MSNNNNLFTSIEEKLNSKFNSNLKFKHVRVAEGNTLIPEPEKGRVGVILSKDEATLIYNSEDYSNLMRRPDREWIDKLEFYIGINKPKLGIFGIWFLRMQDSIDYREFLETIDEYEISIQDIIGSENENDDENENENESDDENENDDAITILATEYSIFKEYFTEYLEDDLHENIFELISVVNNYCECNHYEFTEVYCSKEDSKINKIDDVCSLNISEMELFNLMLNRQPIIVTV